MGRRRHFLFSLGLAGALAGLVIGSASGTYPGGSNGRIAIGVRANGGANIWTMRPDGTDKVRLTAP